MQKALHKTKPNRHKIICGIWTRHAINQHEKPSRKSPRRSLKNNQHYDKKTASMKTQKTRRPRWPVDRKMWSKMPSRGSPELPNGDQNRPLGPPKPSQDGPGVTLLRASRIFFHFCSLWASFLRILGSMLGDPGWILRARRDQFYKYFILLPKTSNF